MLLLNLKMLLILLLLLLSVLDYAALLSLFEGFFVGGNESVDDGRHLGRVMRTRIAADSEKSRD